MTCDQCQHFKIIQEPMKGIDGLYDLGRAECKKYNLVTDFINHSKFKRLETCEDYKERKK